MKNLKKLLLSLIAISAIAVSCSTTENEISTTATISEKWEYSKFGTIVAGQEFLVAYDKNTPNCEKNYIEFIDPAVFKNHAFGDNCVQTTNIGTWTKNGNTITLPIDGIPRTTEIIALTTTTLKLKYDSEGKTVLVLFTKKTM